MGKNYKDLLTGVMGAGILKRQKGGDSSMQKAIDRTKIFKKYQNKWIAFTDNDKIISSGRTLDEALNKAAKKGFKNPIVSKIPDLKYDYLLK